MKRLNILIACEESQAVCIEMRKRGHEAYSCDLLPCSGGHPEWHIEDNIFYILYHSIKWDMMIGFPPCTHLAVSGARHFEEKRKDGRQRRGINFFMNLANANIHQIAIENPVGIMSKIYKKPSQIIQPYYFGDEAQKTTCLWLKNLPLLKHYEKDDMFDRKTWTSKGEFVITPSGKKLPKWYSDNKDPKSRSKTFPGIARAMAEQWTEDLTKPNYSNEKP